MKNNINLMGRLTKDMEVINFESGKYLGVINLATSERFKDKETGEIKQNTEYHTLNLWGNLMKRAEKLHLKKGSLIDIEGKLIYPTCRKTPLFMAEI